MSLVRALVRSNQLEKNNDYEFSNIANELKLSETNSIKFQKAQQTVSDSSLKVKENTESENVMTVPEVAKFLKCSTKKIYRLCKSEIIPCKRLGDGSYRFWKPEIVRWLKGDTYE